ncbi:iron ABC transporter permease [Massilia sp. W12]|uniref:ABC transporter permease n=1 Tax=Massilia sp. W12 TaxID=3126507 RepID=UPI0030CED03E
MAQAHHSSVWRNASLLVAALCLTPLLVLLGALARPDGAIWAHLSAHVLPDLLSNTAWLLAGVSLFTLTLGVGLAWLVAVCDFPGRRFFSWALALPLALPAYVAAFAAVGMLDFTGPLQTWLRDELGWQGGLPPIRSRAGVALVLAFSFYPYIYLLARQAFASQGRRALEVGQSLGLGPWRGFWHIALPAARPWIAGGLLLVWMETLADFGAVSVFNYDTFTTAIYKSWFAMFSMQAAAQLASLLVLLVLLLAASESWARRRRAYHASGKSGALRYPLHGARAWLAQAACVLVLLLAFVAPILQLLFWAWQNREGVDERFWSFVGNSLLAAAGAALAAASAALVLARAARLHQAFGMQLLIKAATLGYAIPGAVLAVGIFIPIAWLDGRLIEAAQALGWQVSAQGFLRGSILVLLLAFVVRFLAVAFHPVDGAMQRITRNQEDAARSLGLSGLALLRRLHWGMLKGGLFTALLMVFVDVMKEMPITLMLRPFGWETLSVRVFQMTSEGMWESAAAPALALVAAGLLPVILLGRQEEFSAE